MKTLKQMGLVSLTQKENQNTNGGASKESSSISDILKQPHGPIYCIWNIPPMDFPL